jgi:SAM-dependent methyltransferase
LRLNLIPWQDALRYVACPHCGELPRLVPGGIECPRGHHFDVAREGYLNLLPGSGRSSVLVGDSGAMLRARRAFLAAGHYEPIAEAVGGFVAETVSAPLPGLTAATSGCVVDVGCGEGYYLASIQRQFDATGAPVPPLIGLDVAKDAARLAARAHPAIAFAVADVTARLPLRDACADFVLSIFAPRNPDEFGRVVRAGGRLLVVIPADDHLSGLRQHIAMLRVEPEKREHVVARLASSFTLTTALPVRYGLTLSGHEAALLAAMSPSARHLPAGALAALAAHPEPITTPVSVELLVFQRRS